MDSTWDKLKRIFIDDHKALTRGYRDLIGLLDDGQLSRAAELAESIDAQAGAHIEFEEQHLYPRIREFRGDQYVGKMYHQHQNILHALVAIRRRATNSKPSPEQIEFWKARLKEGIDHAAACGSLLSHLQTLPEPVQADLLEKILELRMTARKWSQVGAAPDGFPASSEP